MQDPVTSSENAGTLAAYEQTAELFRSFATPQPTDALLPLLRELVRKVPGGSVLVITDELGGPYDAVDACAVLLHLPVPALRVALRKARDAARVLAITVKEGDGEEWTSAKLGVPRWFRYWREEPLRAELAAAGWQVETVWHSTGRRDEWLQVLAT